MIDPAYDGHVNTANPPMNKITGRESKRNKVFWRGATTGGGNEPPGFAALYQRHRAVRMTGWDVDSNVELWLPAATYSTSTGLSNFSAQDPTIISDPPLTHISIPLASLNRAIMDVAFVKTTNAEQYPGGLEKLMAEHRFSGGVYLGGHWQYKYLLDIDGMSYSGRFMSFLASDSVPVKSTMYEEFFGDWIEPW